jgi:hypothetical protein
MAPRLKPGYENSSEPSERLPRPAIQRLMRPRAAVDSVVWAKITG